MPPAAATEDVPDEPLPVLVPDRLQAITYAENFSSAFFTVLQANIAA